MTVPLTLQPLTAERWDDLERLFGPRGAYGGCWCMWWRRSRSEFEAEKGEGNRKALRALVDDGRVPGLLAYEGDQPVAWVSVAPREDYPVLGRSPVLKPLDERPVWCIVCFFVAASHRGRGLTLRLIEAAVDHARAHGATCVEAYPTRPRGRRLPPVSSFMGLPDLFAAAGFEVAARPSDARLIMRRELG